jgi:hypothetical protein
VNYLFYLYYYLFKYSLKQSKTLGLAKFNAYIIIVWLFTINIYTIVTLSSILFFNGKLFLSYILVSNSKITNLIVVLLITSPVFIFVYFLLRRELKLEIEDIETEKNKIIKNGHYIIKVKLYIIISIIMLFSTIIPYIFKIMK